ncbi:Glycosyltransferase [Granulibacter bethesdensis]|nr:Glycosyltransferase [Granulibacter bethesdensis]
MPLDRHHMANGRPAARMKAPEPMKILFAFENPLPSREADAEVFTTTARYLSRHLDQCWLHVPISAPEGLKASETLAGMDVIRAWAPRGPGLVRHLACGLTIVLRRAFREADLVYSRNLFVTWMAVLCGKRVAFDHYRPWPDQIPPLQRWLFRLFSQRHVLIHICHSDYTRQKYLALGIHPDKLLCVHNGFEPDRLRHPVPVKDAKRALGLDPTQITAIYTGRINHKKGLPLLIEAARRLPQIRFLLVGSTGHGPIETMAAGLANVTFIPWQTEATLSRYLFAADVLVIPPSSSPLMQFGSTVLPLKLFLYLASGRPILAGDTPDVRELLEHDRNAWLCRADDIEALAEGLTTLTTDPARAHRLAQTAQADSQSLTWEARASRIATILQTKMQAPPPCSSRWTARHWRQWLGQSRQWFTHLLKTRSWVLPPRPSAPFPSPETPPHG